jgi:hypothetical protein
MRGKSYLPDKEFRYLRHSCYYPAGLFPARRPGHFCLTPYVAIGIGLSLYRWWRTNGCLACSL